ncbi:hypothetical protein Tco_1226447 [Tanacetum coccineum]
MSEALMPRGSTCREKNNRRSRRLGNWIGIARTVTSKEDMMSQNIMKMKRAMMGRSNAMTGVGNGNRLAISNVNR